MPLTYFENNSQLQLAFNFVHYTNQNIFLTGKAGTGKTTFLKTLKKLSPKRMVVVAPTGVAAINAGGVTIHSFFQLPFGPQIPQIAGNHSFSSFRPGLATPERINRFSKNKINLIRSLDLLVIDEISMVRADLMDAIDATLRRFKNRYLPFGGMQLLMIGDLQQLAPVVKEDEWEILKKYYDTCFFFSSSALQKSQFTGIELKHIYRQSEQSFIDLLNKVRDNQMTATDLELLNSRFRPGFLPEEEEGYITLTTHNYQAKHINENRLRKLPSKLHRFHCTIEGDFPPIAYPAEEILEIKTGAQVMFLKNDNSEDKRYYNGKIGKVTNILEDQIEVICPGETEPINVEPDFWENTKYRLNEATSEIEEEVAGKFIQYPLKLAWAITIHKSQGLTFEKAVIDARQSFAHGQVYVALSRCKNLEGMILSTPLSKESVINDNTVTGFIKQVEQNQPNEEDLKILRKKYEMHLLYELFDFKPILNTIAYILKIWNENNSVLIGNLCLNFQEMTKNIQEEMIEVAEKFRPQMEKLANQSSYAEENVLLQERLQKASDYFLSKLKAQIEIPLADAGFETDNRTLRKRIAELIGSLENNTVLKKACMKAVSQGFSIKQYLNAKAVSAIEKPEVNARVKSSTVKSKHPEFYRMLLEWRSNKSLETNLNEPKILLQKVMMEITEILPSTAMELKAIKGMGGKKMEQFGQEILALILTYRHEKGMEIPSNAQQEVQLAGLDTKEMSLVFFKQGLKPDEIAKKRNLAFSTIESHLSHFVANGKLNVFELIDTNKYNTIAQFLMGKDDSLTITQIKNNFGDEVSYGEIRLVMADLKRQTT